MAAEINDTQNRILLVAEKLFAEKGFDGASIRDIAKEADVNIAMISYYFGSKEKLLEHLIISRTSDMRIELENLSNEDCSPIEKINRLIKLYVKRLKKNKCIYQIMHFEMTSQKRTMNLQTLMDVKKKNLVSLEKILHEGQELGLFTRNIIPALIPTTILGTFFHFNVNRIFYQDLLNLKNDSDFDHYVDNQLTTHIQQTINALLTNEK